jgi:antitoxin component YwqK of YwqJK toxin-antitoxin module
MGRLASVAHCGTVQKSDYDPVKDGDFLEYFPNGVVSVRGTTKQGAWNGTVTNYFDNGKPNIVAHYGQGRECGTWKVYDADGNLVRTKDFPEQRDLHGHVIRCPQ